MIGDLPERKRHPAQVRPDLTPLVDVLFLLLVFFLLTSGAARTLPVDLPRADGAPARLEAPLVLTLSPGGWAVDGQPLKRWDSVRRRIRARHLQAPGLTVLIEGDRRVPLQRLVRLLDFLQREGIASVRILVQPQPRGGA